MNKVRRITDLKQENALLVEGLPEHLREDGSLDVRKLSLDLDCSTQIIYRWIGRDRISLTALKELPNLPGSRLTKEELVHYLTD